jgi:hypothetical protein
MGCQHIGSMEQIQPAVSLQGEWTLDSTRVYLFDRNWKPVGQHFTPWHSFIDAQFDSKRRLTDSVFYDIGIPFPYKLDGDTLRQSTAAHNYRYQVAYAIKELTAYRLILQVRGPYMNQSCQHCSPEVACYRIMKDYYIR